MAEVAPQVQQLSFTARLVRNPEWFTVGLILVTCLVVGTLNPRFFQFATLFDLLHSATTVSLFALGTLVVLASGGIDVSFTAIAAFTMYSITKAVFAWWPDAPFFVILVCGAVGGVLLGLINGVLVHRLKAPSLIVTIGTQYLYRGLLLTFVGTQFFMNIPHSMDSFGQLPLFFYHTNDGLRAVLPVSVIALFRRGGRDVVAAEPHDDGTRRVRDGRQLADRRAARLQPARDSSVRVRLHRDAGGDRGDSARIDQPAGESVRSGGTRNWM